MYFVASTPSERPLFLRSSGFVSTAISTFATITMVVLLCNLFGLALVVFQLALPQPDPIAHIFCRAVYTSLRKPECQNNETAPESDAESESHPEEHALDQHVDEFERDVEDEQHQGDLGEVGLFEQRLEGGEEIFVVDVVQSGYGTEESRGEIAIAKEVACPVCVGFLLVVVERIHM